MSHGPPPTPAPNSRSSILARLREKVRAGHAIIGTGAGTGLSAKCEEVGGADLIIIYNSGRYRMAGRGSLAGLMPYGDANAIVVEMAAEVLPIVRDTPVLAGVCGTDPFRLMPVFLEQLKAIGFSGVQNFPTVGLIDGTFRHMLEMLVIRKTTGLFRLRSAEDIKKSVSFYNAGPDQVPGLIVERITNPNLG